MLVVVTLLLASIWWFPLALLVAMAVHVWRSVIASAAVQRGLAREQAAVVAARADVQQALVMAGDERGVYGEYEAMKRRR